MATAMRSKKEFVSSKSTGLTYHKATGLVVKSDKDYTVIGRLSEDKKSVIPMDDETVALCDEHGFEHDPIVEEEANEEVEEKAEEEPPAEEDREEDREEEPEEMPPKVSPKTAPKKEVKPAATSVTKTPAKIRLDADTELRQYFVKEFDAARETIMSVLDNHSVFREVERAQQLDKEVTELREKVTELTAKNEKLANTVKTLKNTIATLGE